MTPKPPEGFDSWLDWAIEDGDDRAEFLRRCAMGEDPIMQRIEMRELPRAELAALRARVAELEQWKESAMLVLGENHVALQQHGQLGEGAADCMNRLAKQVEALADALEQARGWVLPVAQHEAVDAALRAAGRKT